MKRYKQYKNSGIEWLGEIPAHWEIKKLKDVCFVLLSSIDKKIYENEEPIALCNYTDVYYNENITEKINFMISTATKEQIKKLSLYSGDTIITKDSESADDIAIAAYVPYDLPRVVCGYHLAIVRPKDDVRGLFIKRSFDSHYVKSYFASLATGLTRLGLSQYTINNVKILTPSIYEQVKIVKFIESEINKIDTLISEQKKLIALLKEKIISLVLSSINSTKTQYLRFKHVAKIISRPVIQKEGELYTPLGLFNRGRGLFHKESREMKDMGDSDFFWIKEGDLIISGQFAWEGAIALAGKQDAECVVSHRYPVLQGKQEICLTEYLFALLLTKHGNFLLNENSRGAAGRNRPLNINSFMKEKIPIPDMATQEKIAQTIYLRNILSTKTSKQIDLLKERRTALISAAVTGKIDVRDIDINLPMESSPDVQFTPGTPL